jgi:hypothetical protein
MLTLSIRKKVPFPPGKGIILSKKPGIVKKKTDLLAKKWNLGLGKRKDSL